MLVDIVFPIADVRDFVGGAPRRLQIPNWPDPYPPARKFVRAFGPIRRRPQGGAKGIGEGHVCDANGTVRFPRCPAFHTDSNSRIHLVPRFRRFFFDGRGVGKLEVGLVPKQKTAFHLKGTNAVSLLKSLIGCEVTSASTEQLVPGIPKSPRTTLKFNQLPDHVASLFFLATTNRKQIPTNREFAWCVSAAIPMLLIQEGTEERFEPDFRWRSVSLNTETYNKIELSHAWIEWQGQTEARLWRLRYEPGADQDAVRLVRMFLLRLHCEQEVLRTVLNLMDRGQIVLQNDASETKLLQSFLIKLARRLLRPIDRKVGPDQQTILTPDLLDVVCETLHAGAPGFRESLLDRLDRDADLHHNKLARVRALLDQFVLETSEQSHVYVNIVEGNYVNQPITITNSQGVIVTVAEYIQDVTNSVNQTISQSTESDEVKTLIAQLAREIADIAEQLPPETAKQMGDDIETLSKETARAHPRRQWYEVSLEGLREAVDAVGELAKPIAATLAKLWPLLVP